ncbi:mCG145868, partial [Mus musculus]
KIMLNGVFSMSESVSASSWATAKDVLKRKQLNNSFSNNELWSNLKSKTKERNHSSQRKGKGLQAIPGVMMVWPLLL